MTDNIFEIATRNKIRVHTGNMLVSVEDLWDLPLTSKRLGSLEEAWKILNQAIKEYGEESFINNSSVPKDMTVAKAVVEHIITVRQAENEAKIAKQKTAQTRQMLQEAIAKKEQEDLMLGSVEELKERLKALED